MDFRPFKRPYNKDRVVGAFHRPVVETGLELGQIGSFSISQDVVLGWDPPSAHARQLRAADLACGPRFAMLRHQDHWG